MSYKSEILHYQSDYIRLERAAEIAASADAKIAELELTLALTCNSGALRELQRDAARYRWMRDESGNDHHTPWCAVGYSEPTWLTGESLDAEIDAARGVELKDSNAPE